MSKEETLAELVQAKKETKEKKTFKTIKERLIHEKVDEDLHHIFLPDDLEISDKELRSIVKRAEQLRLNKEVEELNSYTGHSSLSSVDFLLRLKKMHIPHQHVKNLTDEDARLKDVEIWDKLRKLVG